MFDFSPRLLLLLELLPSDGYIPEHWWTQAWQTHWHYNWLSQMPTHSTFMAPATTWNYEIETEEIYLELLTHLSSISIDGEQWAGVCESGGNVKIDISAQVRLTWWCCDTDNISRSEHLHCQPHYTPSYMVTISTHTWTVSRSNKIFWARAQKYFGYTNIWQLETE